MNESRLKLGFIGLGIMGAPMAAHLIKAGHQLFVNTIGLSTSSGNKKPSTPAPTACTQPSRVAATSSSGDRNQPK